ncbi:hypothetical protein A2U01_0101437, partial [Trifolium medium]|nr:hypothetical protein [Trifolium medium]
SELGALPMYECPLVAASKHLLTDSMSPCRVATWPLFVYYFIFRWAVEGMASRSAMAILPRMH